MTEAPAMSAAAPAPAQAAGWGSGGSGNAAATRRRFITLSPSKVQSLLHSTTVPVILLLALAAMVLLIADNRLHMGRRLGLHTSLGGPQQGGEAAGLQAPAAEETLQRAFATVADLQEATWKSRADGPETEGLPCRLSGYCSVGKLRAYVGEVDSLEGFKKALNASCYKKDCFHITIGSGAHLLAMNFVMRAWQLGFANVMLHASDSRSCAVLAEKGFHNVTCGWSERDWIGNGPGNKYSVGESRAQWAIRYILFARAVWLGYNVFMIDSDSFLFRDPYTYLKQPPFANISFMSMPDGGSLVNGGTSYIHNAAPGGPAWWTIAAVAERIIFVKQNWDWFVSAFNRTDPNLLGHAMMDQPVLSDIIAWQFLGYPTLAFTQPEAPNFPRDKVFPMLIYPKVKLPFPPEWKSVATDDEFTAFNLTIPFLNGSWPAWEAGPRFPPPGNLSLAFIKLLEEESGYKFPDAFGSPRPGFVMPHNETWAFPPQWLVGAYMGRGRSGWMDLEPPSQVIMHLMYVTGPGRTWGKSNIFKTQRGWVYEASQAIEGRLFPSSTPEQPLPRVLALPPRMHLNATSPTDFRDKSAQLVKLALRLNRVLYMPEPYCKKGSWILPPEHTNEGYELVDPATGKTHRRFEQGFPWILSYGLDENHHCTWWAYVDEACMRTYLYHPDYEELARRLPPGTGNPGPDNTVQLAAGATLQQVLEAAAQKQAPHILFLSGMPDFAAPLPDGEGEADKRFQEWSQGCKWMQEVPKVSERRRRRLGEQERWQGLGQRGTKWPPPWLDN